MIGPRRHPGRPRRGFSLLEVQAAFVVLGLGVAALAPFAVAQVKLVAAMERRLPPNVTYVLISQDQELVRLLASGGGSTQAATSPSLTRSIVVDSVGPSGTGPLDMTATVTIKNSPPG